MAEFVLQQVQALIAPRDSGDVDAAERVDGKGILAESGKPPRAS